MKKNIMQEKGFTLVELIVVLTIMGILAALAIPSFSGYVDDANAKSCKSKMEDLAKAYVTQQVDNGVSNAGNLVDEQLMDEVLKAKGATDESGIFSGLCPSCSVGSGEGYTVDLTQNPDDGTQTMTLVCSVHGTRVDVCSGSPTRIVQSIELITPPTVLDYKVGESFKASGGSIKVTYTDGTTETRALTESMCKGADTNSEGEKNVSVEFQSQTISNAFKITVKPAANIKYIQITSPPVKTDYGRFDTFDRTGLKVEAVYSDGSTKDITSSSNLSFKMNGTTVKLEEITWEQVDTEGTAFKINASYVEGDNTYESTDTSVPESGKTFTIKVTDKPVIRLVQDGQTNDQGKLYYRASLNDRGQAFKNALSESKGNATIQVLIPKYSLEASATGTIDDGIKISQTLTITSGPEVGGRATIYCSEPDKSNLFKFLKNNQADTLTFKDINLEGRGNISNRAIYAESDAGTITLDNCDISGFKLMYSNLGSGGAIHLAGNDTLNMKNSSISNCEIIHFTNENGETPKTVGGAVALENTSTIYMDTNSSISKCTADYGAAVSMGICQATGVSNGMGGGPRRSNGSSLHMVGNAQITGCTSSFGAVFMNGGNTNYVYIKDNAHITGNTSATDNSLACNLYLNKYTDQLRVTGNLDESAAIGVSLYDETKLAKGEQFAKATDENGNSAIAINLANLSNIMPDNPNSLLYGCAGDSSKIIWTQDGNSVCYNETRKIFYDSLESAVSAAASGDTIDIIVSSVDVTKAITINKNLTIKKLEGTIEEQRSDGIKTYGPLETATINTQVDGNLFSITASNVTFQNLTIENTDADATNRRAISKTSGGGQLTIDKCTIQGFIMNSDNGAVTVTKGALTINGGSIKNCMLTSGNGGAVCAKTADAVTIDGTTFEKNTSPGGGAIYSDSAGSPLTLKNVTIKNCTSSGMGGAITAYKKQLILESSTIDNCYAQQGGALRIADTAESKITNTAINNCYSTTNGGVLFCRNSDVTITGGTITGNYVTTVGYALLEYQSATSKTLTLDGVQLIENGNAKETNGSIVNLSTDVTIKIINNTSITGNLIGNNGAVYVTKDKKLNIQDNVKITNNTKADGTNANVSLSGNNNLTVSGNMGAEANVGVTAANNRMTEGKQFGVTTTPAANSTANLTAFHQDTGDLVGVAGNGNQVIWGKVICRNVTKGIPYFGETALQNAIKAADSGDTIEMLVDEYEMGNFDNNKISAGINKNLTITTATSMKTPCTFKPIDDYPSGAFMFNLSGTIEVAFENVNFKGTYDPDNPGTQIIAIRDDINSNGKVVLEHCSFSNLYGTSPCLYGLRTTKKYKINNCEFKDLKGGNPSSAMYLAGQSSVDITNSTFSNCTGTLATINFGKGCTSINIENVEIDGCGGSVSDLTGGVFKFDHYNGTDDGKTKLQISNLNLKNCVLGRQNIYIGQKYDATINDLSIENCTASDSNIWIDATSNVTMTGDTKLTGNTAKNAVIKINKADTTLALQGNTAITDNTLKSTEKETGAVLNDDGTLQVQDNVQVTRNVLVNTITERNVYVGESPLIQVTGDLGEDALIGVTSTTEKMEPRVKFGETIADSAASVQKLNRFYQDNNETVLGGAGDGKNIVWMPTPVCKLIRNGQPVGSYPTGEQTDAESLQKAIGDAQDGDIIQMMVPEYTVDDANALIIKDKALTITTAEDVGKCIFKPKQGHGNVNLFTITGSKDVTFEGVDFVGDTNTSKKTIKAISDKDRKTGSLTLKNCHFKKLFGENSCIDASGTDDTNKTYTLTGCTIEECTGTGGLTGSSILTFPKKSNITLTDTNITGCTVNTMIKMDDPDSTLVLNGTTAITDNTIQNIVIPFSSESAIIYDKGNLQVQDSVKVTNNKLEDMERNIYIAKKDSYIQVTGDMAETAKVGVTCKDEDQGVTGGQFGQTTDGTLASEIKNLGHFYLDTDTTLSGSAGNANLIVWKKVDGNDGWILNEQTSITPEGTEIPQVLREYLTSGWNTATVNTGKFRYCTYKMDGKTFCQVIEEKQGVDNGKIKEKLKELGVDISGEFSIKESGAPVTTEYIKNLLKDLNVTDQALDSITFNFDKNCVTEIKFK